MKMLSLACVVFAACAFLPSDAETWTPPDRYREIWAQAEKCTGTHGNYDQVIWLLVPGHDFKCRSGRCIGEWDAPHTILIAEEWKSIDWVARHEMIHELTRFTHDGDDRGPGPRDIRIWGNQCHSMWGYLSSDPGYRP